MRVTATLFCRREKFCFLVFVRVIKSFGREELLAFEALNAFKIESRPLAPARTFNASISWKSPNPNEMKWFALFMTVRSMSRSLTGMGRIKDLIKMKADFEVLKRKTGYTMQNRSNRSCSSNNWSFCICKNWVEEKRSLSQPPRMTCSRQIWRWLSFSKKLPSVFFFCCLDFKKQNFFCVLLCEARCSRYPMKDATRWWGSEL